MSRLSDQFLTAFAPLIWGSTYIVTTQMLPQGYPLTSSVLRALPAGILLLLIARQLPPVSWIWRLVILAACNFSVFWALLFVAAYRLPGGVAATLGAIQPLIVLLLARYVLETPLTMRGIIAALAGIAGVGMLILGPEAQLDWLGVIAAICGAVSMATGVVLSRKWQPPVSALTFTAWQLTVAGILLTPVALFFEPPLPHITLTNGAGFCWLSMGSAVSCFFWFRGIARLGPAQITSLGFLSPLSAVILGWMILGESLTPLQGSGAVVILLSVWLGQNSAKSSRKVEAKMDRASEEQGALS